MVNTKKTLFWGATLCAHAVEGADFNADWWRWEQRPAHIAGGATSERAADHFNRYAADLDMARKIGCNTLQVSVSWARIEPERGQFDDAALLHYTAVFRAMEKRGLRPICVLQEHTLPGWFCQLGGWECPDAASYFAAYAAAVYKAIGSCCDYWIPHFEPLLWLGMTYGENRWPLPTGCRSRRKALDGLAKSHRAVWTYLKGADEKNRIGLSLYAPTFYPSDPHSPWDEKIQSQATAHLYEDYPRLLGATENSSTSAFCFIALSCPGALGVRLAPFRKRNAWTRFENLSAQPCALDEAQWGGAALSGLVNEFTRWGVPLLITGTGCATDDDEERCRHLLDTCDGVLELQNDGVDLMGLCYRSLLDGFEWHHGFKQRWGLVHVDRNTQNRTPNSSAFLYQDIIRSGAIHPGVVSRFAAGWHSPTQEVS